jgi:hypothetical protein
MSDEHGPIPPGRLRAYRVFFLVERLVAAGLFVFALTQTSQSASGGIWWLLLAGAVVFAGLAAWSAYELVAKPGKL